MSSHRKKNSVYKKSYFKKPKFYLLASYKWGRNMILFMSVLKNLPSCTAAKDLVSFLSFKFDFLTTKCSSAHQLTWLCPECWSYPCHTHKHTNKTQNNCYIFTNRKTDRLKCFCWVIILSGEVRFLISLGVFCFSSKLW